MRMRSNLRACKARQATRKDSDEKRRGAFEHTRPFVSMTSYSPASKDQQQ